MSKCVRCGRENIKTERRYTVLPDGSKGDPDICISCNAARWVVKRFGEAGTISMEECRKLPRTLIFDPKGDDIEEEAAGKAFQKIIDSYLKKGWA